MSGVYRINPRIRAYGKARIDVTRRAKDEEEWQNLWKPPAHAYPFSAGEGWKFCIEYKVDDYAAEIGFFIDSLGFLVNSFSPSFAQFTDPDQSFFFSVTAVQEGEQSTPPEALRIQIKVSDLVATVTELENRGIPIEQQPTPVQEGARLHFAVFRTPHGIPIDLWGELEPAVPPSQGSSQESDSGLERIEVEEEEEGVPQSSEEEEPVETGAVISVAESIEGEETVEEKPASTREPIGFWSQFSKSVTGLKGKSLHSVIPNRDPAEKPNPGNGEITYTPIEEEGSDTDDSSTDEEYP